MKITDLLIDRYGVWHDVNMPLSESGINVLYGPNEAGKSTLMRFIRGVLYGYGAPQEQSPGPQLRPIGCLGGMRVRHEEREHVIRRESQPGNLSRLRIDNLDWGHASQQRLNQMLSGIPESLYERVFAIGLSELQELATLNAEDVAQHIYGISLGPEGQRILEAQASFDEQRTALARDDYTGGGLVTLAKRLESLDRQLAGLGDSTRRHRELRDEQDRLNAHIEDCRQRQEGLRTQLRGHQFLQRVHGPWKRQRQLLSERDALPIQKGFPADGLDQLQRQERDLSEVQQRKARLLDRARQARDQAERLAADVSLEEHRCEIRAFESQMPEMHSRRQRIATLQQQSSQLRRQLDDVAPSTLRMASTQTGGAPATTEGLIRMLQAARAYQSALSKRTRAVRTYRKLVSATQKRQAEFNEQLKPLGGLSIDRATRSARSRLAQLSQLSRLRQQEARLLARGEAIDEQMLQGTAGRELPPFFYFVLWFFTLAGIVLFFAGIWGVLNDRVAGGWHASLIGAIYSLFGLTVAGITWTLKQHFEGIGFENPSGLSNRQQDVDNQLQRVRKEILTLIGPGTSDGEARKAESGPAVDIDQTDLVLQVAARLAELEAWQQEEHQIQLQRRRLSDFRESLRRHQQDVGLRRRQWCDVLRDVGIPETLKIDTAFERLPLVAQTGDVTPLMEAERLHGELQAEQRILRDYERRIEELTSRLPRLPGGQTTSPEQRISLYVEKLDAADRATEERTRLRKEARDLRRQASELDEPIARLREQQQDLYLRAGVTSRQELEIKTRAYARHNELTRLIADVGEELRVAAATEPQLAVVEEDLRSFNSQQNQHAIETIERELLDIDQDRQQAHERLGSLRRELEALASDRTSVGLRFEREQLAAELHRMTEKWCALELSREAIDQIRHRIERHGQSETLRLASEYLDRLTGGKYHNVWCPLDERRLLVDDDAQQSLCVEHLSTGTREQLFLALRLAIIRRFALEGVELPMVLDDVFVNFDQARTESAVDTILDFAGHDQQVLLFTCHLHLAHLFEAKGVEPIWLPGNSASVQGRRAG